MKFPRIYLLLGLSLVILASVSAAPSPQEPIFELPVQLVGFPVIIAAVRLSNFVKKLAYTLNPDTYASRAKRSTTRGAPNEFLDVDGVEKKLIAEMGNGVCVYERICANYAVKTSRKQGRDVALDWDHIFSMYKKSPDPMKDKYLLSVFLGNIVGNPSLCHQLAKRGRGCDPRTLQ